MPKQQIKIFSRTGKRKILPTVYPFTFVRDTGSEREQDCPFVSPFSPRIYLYAAFCFGCLHIVFDYVAQCLGHCSGWQRQFINNLIPFHRRQKYNTTHHPEHKGPDYHRTCIVYCEVLFDWHKMKRSSAFPSNFK